LYATVTVSQPVPPPTPVKTIKNIAILYSDGSTEMRP
jgi:hypothetical protein